MSVHFKNSKCGGIYRSDDSFEEFSLTPICCGSPLIILVATLELLQLFFLHKIELSSLTKMQTVKPSVKGKLKGFNQRLPLSESIWEKDPPDIFI